MPEVLAKSETGIKWWLRYVIIPLIGSGGLLGVYMTARQVVAPRPAEAAPAVTAGLPAATVEGLPLPTFTPMPAEGTPAVTAGLPAATAERLPSPTFTPMPTAWPPGDQVSSDPHSRCDVGAAGLADPGREHAVVVQFKISGRGGYCTWITPLNGFNAQAMKQVSFWVKGRKGGEEFAVGLRDRGTPEASAPGISRTASDHWSQVIIPLNRFGGLDMTSLEELSLTIQAGSSELYVDRIEFLP